MHRGFTANHENVDKLEGIRLSSFGKNEKTFFSKTVITTAEY